MNRILVIGATGNIGRQVIAQLPDAGAQVSALVRDPHSAVLPPYVDVVRGDLTQPETLKECLDGIDAVFLVWTAPPDAVTPALERIVRRARRIVFLSSPYNTAHPFFQKPQPNPVSALHAQIERLIEASGRQWTFLRPGVFAANAQRWWAPRIRAGERTAGHSGRRCARPEQGVVRWPYLAAATAPIHERDIAAVAVRALCEKDGHTGAEYVLTGPQSLTQLEQLCAIGSAIGRSVPVEEISPEEARRELLALMPDFVAKMLLDAWAAAIGQPALVTSTVAEITGHTARTFQEWVADHAEEFR